MTDIVEITTTVETAEQAQVMSEQLVDARLAACVQTTGPIRSVYRWQGKVCQATEYRCTVKSTKSLAPKVIAAIEHHHAYDVPEILVSVVADCSAPYAEWLRSQVEQ